MYRVERGKWKLVQRPSTILNLITGRDENIGRAHFGAQAPAFVSRRFQRAQRRGADGDQAPAFGLGAIDGVGRRLRNFAPFRVHYVGAGVLGLHRQERAGADMQCHVDALDARRIEPREQFVGEMQTRGGRGNSAVPRGIHGLIILGVSTIGCALAGDVRWQRRGADFGDCFVERRAGSVKAKRNLALLALLLDTGEQAVIEEETVARLQALAGFRKRAPRFRAQSLDQIKRHPH